MLTFESQLNSSHSKSYRSNNNTVCADRGLGRNLRSYFIFSQAETNGSEQEENIELLGSGISQAGAAKEMGCCVKPVRRRMDSENMGVWGKHGKRKGRSDEAEAGCEAGSEAAEHGETESEQNKTGAGRKGAGRKLFVCPTKP